MSLQSLPALLRDEPALAAVLGRRSAVLAVPEAARPLALAGLARVSGRSPLLVAVPTGTAAAAAGRRPRSSSSPPEDVELFPAWETLPFERVSPSVEAMGRRLRVLWRLQDATRPAGLGSSSPASGPCCNGWDLTPRTSNPQSSDPARCSTPRCCWPSSSASGYRREELVEHRGEVARRGSIIDVFPSTADAPVRIDLWGDEVDRLSEFSVHDQRSTDPTRRSRGLPRTRAAADRRGPGACRTAGRRRAMGPRAVGAPGRGPDVRRDGELAALAGRRRAPADRPAAVRGPGDPGRAQAPERPGRRRAGRGGRPRRDAGPDVGGRRRRGLPPAAPRPPSDC